MHDIYREWRDLFNQYTPAKYAVGESWSPFTTRIFQYAKPDELGAVFDFSMSKAAWNREEYRTTIERTHRYALAAETAPTWVLGNHDVPRIASRLGLPSGANIEQWVTSNGTNPPIDPALAARRARAAALVMLGLPGTAFVYQGEELGLPEDFDLTEDEIQDPNWERSGHYFKGRDGCRVPLRGSQTARRSASMPPVLRGCPSRHGLRSMPLIVRLVTGLPSCTCIVLLSHCANSGWPTARTSSSRGLPTKSVRRRCLVGACRPAWL